MHVEGRIISGCERCCHWVKWAPKRPEHSLQPREDEIMHGSDQGPGQDALREPKWAPWLARHNLQSASNNSERRENVFVLQRTGL